MKLGVSEIARTLGVDRDLVKTWAFRFKEYLSDEANPPKGTARQFTPGDLLVFRYVSDLWEDEPDMENIEIGLNRREHGDEPYTDILTFVNPIFQDPPEGLNEDWQHGSLLGGIVEGYVDKFMLANAYKTAGDILVDSVPRAAEAYEMVWPVLYNYRHSIELYLKDVVKPKELNHDLESLYYQLRDYLKKRHNADIPEWFRNLDFAFHEFDPDSATFRYGKVVYSRRTGDMGEFWIDLPHTKRLMSLAAQAFERIKHA